MEQRAANKADRLLQIEQLLLSHPEGLTQAEIARRVGVHRSTIWRDLTDLSHRFAVYETDDGRIAINRDAYLTEVRFTLHEAMAVHLASRLMATTTDKHNPHAASALRKLAESLSGLAPFVSTHVRASADLMDAEARRHDPVYLDVLETLTRAWSLGRKVALKHQMEDRCIIPYTFAPYYIEPYAIGRTAHVIGYREPPGAIRTFKIERIRSITLLDEAYTIPADFDPAERLADAWGIWTSEQEPVEVVLRFHPRVAYRVRETRWHRNEMLEPQPDGGIIWRARVAEPREMLPWVRGWGADVEVLGPPSLREAVMRDVRRMVQDYELGGGEAINPQMSTLLRCWGKTKKGQGEVFHPALYHMLDVGNTARVLLGDSVSPRWRRVLAGALGADAATLGDWLPYLIAGHDIGKLTLAFQRQNRRQCERLQSEGFDLDSWREDLDMHHSVLGQVYVREEAVDLPLSETWRDLWYDVVGGHHGVFGSRQAFKTARTRLAAYEPPLWRELRRLADSCLRRQFLSGTLPEESPSNLARATLALTGFTILCDWLGSDERFFSPSADVALDRYAAISFDRAQRAVQAAGFGRSTRSATPPAFGALFPDKQPPRPLQAAVDRIPQAALNGPSLVIIEAPTGEGKTEAALAIAHRLAQAGGTDALYYALPTTATSNQMHTRVQAYLERALGLPGEVQLIHGQAYLQEDDLDAQPLDNGDTDGEDVVSWFTSKKRAILAPFGVGTVDQAEMAALNVKHVALRLMGLAGKVVIFDEVHAYDTYMTTIVERLLAWLSALGTSVIILSATLPQKQRAALAHAYGVTLPPDPAQAEAYPSLWVLPRDGEPYLSAPEAYQPDRPLAVNYLHLRDDETEARAQWLLDAVRDGGCACWITNTVARAQELYRALLDASSTQELDLDLLHARFPFAERARREARLTRTYGPPPSDSGTTGTRPRRGIVVGTQVLEQSLDLDFDVMVSDLAPIDLLLQRAGRLQRHQRPRPSAFAEGPVLWINAPQKEDGAPDTDIDSFIYPEYLLLQTWTTLQAWGDVLRLPYDYRPLVEDVYRVSDLAPSDVLQKAWDALHRKEANAAKEAEQRLIPGPETGGTFCRRIARVTFEEDETGASWIVAQTRLGRESVNIIPLERLDARTARLVPDGQRVDLTRAASPARQRYLLRQHLRVSRPEIVRAVKRATDLPALFTRSPRLRGFYPLWLENGAASFPTLWGESEVTVALDSELGLVITSHCGS